RNVVTYIHDNPVKPRIVADPTEYVWSSAHHLARERRPRWLTMTWTDAEIERRGGEGNRAARLLDAFPMNVDDDFRAQIERRLKQRIPESMADEDVTLHYVATPRTIRWTIRKGHLADGTRPWHPPVRQDQVVETIEVVQRRRPMGSKTLPRTWRRMTILLYRLAGLTQRAIGHLLNLAESTVSRDMQDHRHALRGSKRYAALASIVIATARAAAA
ncbi:MAG: hypothetical protein OER88_02575, partial [Planctomycetota bacterium]|nr:hypothetical protein [Planctomycetota bacterium]